MRQLLSVLSLIVFLGVATPAEAQLRQDVQAQQAQAKLYGSEGPSFSLNRLFSPDHFRMQHSYEMSFGSYGGTTSSLGMYTNTMMFQFNDKLAARVDMSFAHSPLGDGIGQKLGLQQDNGQFFLRNAEVAYRPNERMQLHLSFRQSPYGSYMSPYGYYGQSHGGYGSRHHNLFWNNALH
jgi:hypothetical protein